MHEDVKKSPHSSSKNRHISQLFVSCKGLSFLLVSKVTIRNGGFPCAFYQTTSPSFEPLIEYVQRLCKCVQSKWDWSAYF